MYFGEAENQAVIDYINEPDVEIKNKIFKDRIQEAMLKLVYNVVNRYKIYTGYEYMKDLELNVLSHTVEQLGKFKHENGSKAYSYFGTIARNNMKYISKTLYKKDTMFLDIDGVVTDVVEKQKEYQTSLDDVDMSDIATVKMRNMIDLLKNKVNLELNKDSKEFSVGNALIYILENWETIFVEDPDATNNRLKMFTKNKIMMLIKDQTNLTSKEVKVCLFEFTKRYKKMVYSIITEMDYQ